MQWNQTSHPYRNDTVGGVNSYSVAFFNWVVVGGLIWFVFVMLFSDMTPAQTAATKKPADDAGVVYTPEDYAREAVAAIQMPEIPPAVNVTVEVVPPTPSAAVSNSDGDNTVPTALNEPYSRIGYTVGYSYYNPRLGGVNCFDFDNGSCNSPLADGSRWQDWIDRRGVGVVAVAPEFFDWGVEFGDEIIVETPADVAGVYIVKDICSGCSAFYWSDGMYRMDFLSTEQLLPWATQLSITLPADVEPR